MAASAPRNALDQHPFVARLLQHVALNAADIKQLGAIIQGELLIYRRRDLVVDGYEYRKLCFVSEGYAMRYKLLRNGKRQILNVILPGDIVGLPGSFYERAVYSVTAITDLRMHVCALDRFTCSFATGARNSAWRWPGSPCRRRPLTPSTSSTSAGARRSSGCRIFCSSCTRGCGRRPAEEDRFTLPFSQEVIADVLGLSVPHLNRMMQRLRAEKLIANSERVVEFLDAERDAGARTLSSRWHWRRSRRRQSEALPAAGTEARALPTRTGI